MTEFEKKLLLTKDEYDYLMGCLTEESHLLPKSTVTQINYYFDTDDFAMNRQNTTCRIRLKDGKYKATVKKHISDADRSTETEMEIYSGLDRNAFTDMGLKLQGELVTERCVAMKEADCTVMLDKNEYLGHTDYELEIEYPPGHEKDAQAILHIFRNMLARRKCFLICKESMEELPGVPSKSNRFFERMRAVKATAPKSVSGKKTSLADRPEPSYPDDRIHSCPDAFVPGGSMCLSCIKFVGHSCDAPSPSCYYGHYESKPGKAE